MAKYIYIYNTAFQAAKIKPKETEVVKAVPHHHTLEGAEVLQLRASKLNLLIQGQLQAKKMYLGMLHFPLAGLPRFLLIFFCFFP